MPFPNSEALLKRDQAIVLAALVIMTLLAGIYIFAGAGTGMNPWAMSTWRIPAIGMDTGPEGQAWDPAYWVIMLAMWWIMMIAMMVPSAAPMILLYARAARPSAGARGAAFRVMTFLSGYLLSWFAFSLIATSAEWALEQSHLLSGAMMWSTSAVLSGALMIAVGAYQIAPLKGACLAGCRSQAVFITQNWKLGPFRMGLKHGAFCVGCCAALMTLLFVGGAMNLIWIAALAIFVSIEKLTPLGPRLMRPTAWALIAAGCAVLAISFG